MDLEAIEPAGEAKAPGGIADKYLVLPDTAIVTDPHRGRINEGDSGTGAQTTGFQIDGQGSQGARDVFDKALIADQLRKGGPQVPLHMLAVIGLEVPIM